MWFALIVLLSCGDPGTPPPPPPPTAQERVWELRGFSRREIVARRDELGVRLRTDPDPLVRAEIAATMAYVARDRGSIPHLSAALDVEQDPEVQIRLVASLISLEAYSSVDGIVLAYLRGKVHPSIEECVLHALRGVAPWRVRASLAAHPDTDDARVARVLAAIAPSREPLPTQSCIAP